MKRIIAIIGLIAIIMLVAGCSTSTGSTTSQYTSEEQEMIVFASTHIDQMEALVNDTLSAFDDGQDAASVAERMDPIAESYSQICDEYNATNSGTLAGGRVARLEELWEECGNDVRYADRAILNCYLDPDSVDVDQAIAALAEAQVDVDLIREEIASLTGDTY